MWSTLEFIMVGCLFADLVYVRGAQVWLLVKNAVTGATKSL